MNTTADKAQIERIISNGLQGRKSVSGRSEKPSADGCMDGFKRPDGKASIDRQLVTAIKVALEKIPVELRQEVADLYPVWWAKVRSGEMKHSVRPGKQFLSEKLCRGRKITLTPAGMEAIISIWSLRAVNDGVLRLTPNWTSGKQKYQLIEE